MTTVSEALKSKSISSIAVLISQLAGGANIDDLTEKLGKIKMIDVKGKGRATEPSSGEDTEVDEIESEEEKPKPKAKATPKSKPKPKAKAKDEDVHRCDYIIKSKDGTERRCEKNGKNTIGDEWYCGTEKSGHYKTALSRASATSKSKSKSKGKKGTESKKLPPSKGSSSKSKEDTSERELAALRLLKKSVKVEKKVTLQEMEEKDLLLWADTHIVFKKAGKLVRVEGSRQADGTISTTISDEQRASLREVKMERPVSIDSIDVVPYEEPIELEDEDKGDEEDAGGKDDVKEDEEPVEEPVGEEEDEIELEDDEQDEEAE